MTNYSEQIPFYLNGTLSEEEQQQFENALQNNPALQVELESWREIAQAVVDDIAPHTSRLPPISQHVRENLQTRPPATHQDIPAPPPGPAKTWSFPAGGNLSLSLVAAVALMASVGILIYIINQPAATTTATEIAILSTQATATEQFGGPGPVDPINNQNPTSTPQSSPVLPPTVIIAASSVAPLTLTPPPIAAAVQADPTRPQGGGASGPTFTPVPPPQGTIQPFSNNSTATTLRQPTASGNCFVVNNTGATLNIYQAASPSSDIIGVMAPGQQYDTWLQTSTDASRPFYQVFLPNSSIRLGWVDALEVDLFGPSGGVCNSLLEPTATNPAFPSQLPTPITGEECRVSSATSGPLRVYPIPAQDAATLRTYQTGDLLLVTASYQQNWLQVLMQGIGLGWVQREDVIINGDCETLRVLETFFTPTPTVTPVPSITPAS